MTKGQVVKLLTVLVGATALALASAGPARADGDGGGGRFSFRGSYGGGYRGGWGWRGPVSRGYYYGGRYGGYDPWLYPGYGYSYGYGYPYSVPEYGYDGYGYAGPSYYDLDQRAAYNLGLHDGLSGSPPHYVKGETPGYKGTNRDAYYAGYYKGLVQRDRQQERRGTRQPPQNYEPPSSYKAPTYY